MVIKLLIMALAYISFGTSPASTGGMLITGLSSDTKPASPVNGWVFLETNTAKMFIANAGAWTSTTILPFANGGISGSAAAPATTGTLATGTTSARFFSISFRCLDGTIWTEIARTASQT